MDDVAGGVTLLAAVSTGLVLAALTLYLVTLGVAVVPVGELRPGCGPW